LEQCHASVGSNNVGKHTINGKINTTDEYIHRLDVQGALPGVC